MFQWRGARSFLITAVVCMAMAASGCSSPGHTAGGANETSPAPGKNASNASVTASWELLNAAEISPESTVLRLGVTRIQCASGITGTVLEPEIQINGERIMIRTSVESQEPGDYSCPGNNVVPVTVNLRSPIGERELFDASCLDTDTLATAFCVDGGVRWRP